MGAKEVLLTRVFLYNVIWKIAKKRLNPKHNEVLFLVWYSKKERVMLSELWQKSAPRKSNASSGKSKCTAVQFMTMAHDQLGCWSFLGLELQSSNSLFPWVANESCFWQAIDKVTHFYKPRKHLWNRCQDFSPILISPEGFSAASLHPVSGHSQDSPELQCLFFLLTHTEILSRMCFLAGESTLVDLITPKRFCTPLLESYRIILRHSFSPIDSVTLQTHKWVTILVLRYYYTR